MQAQTIEFHQSRSRGVAGCKPVATFAERSLAVALDRCDGVLAPARIEVDMASRFTQDLALGCCSGVGLRCFHDHGGASARGVESSVGSSRGRQDARDPAARERCVAADRRLGVHGWWACCASELRRRRCEHS